MFSEHSLGEQVPYDVITRHGDWEAGQNEERSVYDAMYAVNEKMSKCFGEAKYFSRKKAHVCFNDKLVSI